MTGKLPHFCKGGHYSQEHHCSKYKASISGAGVGLKMRMGAFILNATGIVASTKGLVLSGKAPGEVWGH